MQSEEQFIENDCCFIPNFPCIKNVCLTNIRLAHNASYPALSLDLYSVGCGFN